MSIQVIFEPKIEPHDPSLYVAAQSLEQASRPNPTASASGAAVVLAEAPRKELRDAAKEKLGAANFVAGFGSMGGEEFVSYLNISDSLLRSGGKEWSEWNGKIKERLVKLQNQDGTWAGHHCITGRVACTASEVMTIRVDGVVRQRFVVAGDQPVVVGRAPDGPHQAPGTLVLGHWLTEEARRWISRSHARALW